ncbi:unnamed protein product [Adineta steineri]|uniref:ADP ribosyltransferase domain-containing protein n=1 Tax=Adineta steineri TaxID=433720 RepID=A0A814G376_9BILA|nr:unnamed protein product [Adineta steineri]CAF0990789.1 unnamed protein product [Adineta steineri]
MSSEDGTDLEARISSLTTADCNQENIFIICYNFNNADKIKEDLLAVDKAVTFCTDIDLCVEEIKSKKKEKIFLIISATDACKILPEIATLSQLNSVFIWPENQDECKRLIDDYCEVRICNNSNDVIKSINEKIKCIGKPLECVSFYDQHQKSTRILPTQSGEHLWFQLFHEVIGHLPHDNEAKKEMLSVCREYYRNNPRYLNDIDKFDENYDTNECIRWYTKNTFVYRMINKALRTEDIEQLYRFRFYIADLSKHLAQEYKKMKNRNIEKMVLYHGASLKKEELEILKLMKGKIFATNGYWSTSLDRSCAVEFSQSDPDAIPVLFEIKWNLHDCNDSIIFADISHLSEFDEKEHLVDADSIFQIEKIEEEIVDNVKLDVFYLKASGEGQELAKQYIEEYRQEMKYESPRIMLGILLKRIGKFDQSLDYFKELLKNPGKEKLSRIHHRIGIALTHRDECPLALEHLKKAYDLSLEVDQSDEINLARLYHDKGLVFKTQGKFSQALQWHWKAIHIIGETHILKNRLSADIYSSIGHYYLCKKDYVEADCCYQKALEIRQSCLPLNHAHHAFSYINLSKKYNSEGNYKKALDYNLRALELRQKCLLPDHLNIASSLHHVGKMYYKNKDSDKALDYYWKSLEMTKKCLPPPQQRTVPGILEDIASIYEDDPKQSLEYRLEALAVLKTLKSINYEYLVRTIDKIACTYKRMNNMEDSLKYYEEAICIREKELPRDKFHLAENLDNLAFVYERMRKPIQALDCYNKIMTMCTESYHSYHRLCIKTIKNIKRIKQKMKKI